MDSADRRFPELQELANKIRVHVLQMTSNGGSSHIGSAFSMADMIAVFVRKYFTYKPD